MISILKAVKKKFESYKSFIVATTVKWVYIKSTYKESSSLGGFSSVFIRSFAVQKEKYVANESGA